MAYLSKSKAPARANAAEPGMLQRRTNLAVPSTSVPTGASHNLALVPARTGQGNTIQCNGRRQVAPLDPTSRLLNHTTSSAARKLATMREHPGAFGIKQVPFERVHGTAEAMREHANDAAVSAMTYDFDEATPGAQHFEVSSPGGHRGESGIMTTRATPPVEELRGPGAHASASDLWLDSVVSTARGAGTKLAKHAELMAKGQGKRGVSLAAFQDADQEIDAASYWKKQGYAPTGAHQEKTEEGPNGEDQVYSYPVYRKKPSPKVI